MGAAYLAGLSVGYWKNKDAVRENWAVDQIFEPQIQEEESTKDSRMEKGSSVRI